MRCANIGGTFCGVKKFLFVGLTFGTDLRIIIGKAGSPISAGGPMSVDLHKLALRLKVIEILDRYAQARRQLNTMRMWKKLWIHPN